MTTFLEILVKVIASITGAYAISTLLQLWLPRRPCPRLQRWCEAAYRRLHKRPTPQDRMRGIIVQLTVMQEMPYFRLELSIFVERMWNPWGWEARRLLSTAQDVLNAVKAGAR